MRNNSTRTMIARLWVHVFAAAASVGIIHNTTQTVGATNTYFLPGDAFFHTALTTERLNALSEEESPLFFYARPSQESPAFCGYAGFAKLTYEKMPKSLRTNLVKLGLHLRSTDHPSRVERRTDTETGNLEEREINPLHLFFYNEKFRGRVGLKFNEAWHRHTLRFESFVPDHKLVAEEWRLAEKFSGLKVELPFKLEGGKKPGTGVDEFLGRKIPEPFGGPAIEEPVIARGTMMCVVVPGSDRSVFLLKQEKPQQELLDVAWARDGAVKYVVTSDGISGFRVENSKWQEFDPFGSEAEKQDDDVNEAR